MKRMIVLAVIIAACLFLAGCLPGDGRNTPEKPAGFFWGIWHGWMAPISLIVGLFNKAIRVYEPANTGWWYDLGFYLAVVGGWGSLSFFRKKQNKKS
jgi:hypothetical protein